MRVKQAYIVLIILTALSIVTRPEPVVASSGADTLYQTAQTFYSDKKFDSTIYYCSLTLASDSTLINAYFTRGASYEKQGQVVLALDDYLRFARLSQLFSHNSGYLQYALSRISLADGQKMKFSPAEQLRFEPADNNWKIGFQNRGQNETLIEYIRKDEKIKNWSELLSTRFYPGRGGADQVQQLYASLIAAARERCTKSRINNLISGRLNIIYEWNNRDCVSDTVTAEYELARVFASERGVHRIAIACKDSKKYESIKSQWFDILMNTIVKQKP